MQLDTNDVFNVLRLLGNINSVNGRRAAINRPQRLQHLQCRRLTSAVGAEDAEDLAFLDLKRHAVDDILAIVSLDELVNFYDWFGLSHINSFLLPSRETSRTVIARFWDYYSTRNPISNSENRFETKKNADKSTFFLSIICKKQDILSV